MVGSRNIVIGVVGLLLVVSAVWLVLSGQGEEGTDGGLIPGLPDIGGDIVATVNGEEINSGEVVAVQQSFEQQGQQISEEEVIERLIDQKIVSQQAEQGGYTFSDEEAESVMETQLAQQGASLDDYKRQLASQGVSYKEQLVYIKEDLAIQAYLSDAIGEEPLQVTEEEAREFYETHKQQDPEEAPPYEEVESQVIAALQQQKWQEAVVALIQELRSTADIEYR